MFRLVCIVPFFYNKGQLQTEIFFPEEAAYGPGRQ